MDKYIGMELRALNNLILRYVENHCNKKKVDSLTGTNGWIIKFLDENKGKDIYQKDIEETFTITRSTASKVIKLMVQKGVVKQESVPHDARLKKLVLTPKGEEINNFMKCDCDRVEEELIKGFSPEELQQFKGYIDRMKENMRK